MVRQFPVSAMVILLGDFNGRLGRSHNFTSKLGVRAEDPGGVTGEWSAHDSDNEQGQRMLRYFVRFFFICILKCRFTHVLPFAICILIFVYTTY